MKPTGPCRFFAITPVKRSSRTASTIHRPTIKRCSTPCVNRSACAIVTPWNFPIAIPTWKIAPALAFGNTVVIKPASDTPLCAVRLVEALHEAGLPAGVLNLVTGSAGDVGEPLLKDPRVEAISFTGSNAVGQELRHIAAERGTKLQLELGGKNPAIVLGDADVDHALTHVINGAMMSTGQKCTATSRAIIERSRVDEFTTKLSDRIAKDRRRSACARDASRSGDQCQSS